MVNLNNPEEVEKLRESLTETINTANELTFLKNIKGWQIVLDAFDDIEGKALEQLGQQLPGDEKAILAAHSVWYAAKEAFKSVREAVDNAILQGETAKEMLIDIDRKPENNDWL